MNFCTAATYISVDPSACIHFTNTCETSDHGAEKLIEVFENSSGSSELYQTPGFDIGNEAPCIEYLVGSLSTYVYTHFMSPWLSDREVEGKVKASVVWFDIVDGLHSKKEFRWMVSIRAVWQDMKYFVIMMKRSFYVERYL